MDNADSGNVRIDIAALDPQWRRARAELACVCEEAVKRAAIRIGAPARATALLAAASGGGDLELLEQQALRAARAPETAGDAWLRSGLEALAEAAACLANPHEDADTATGWTRSLAIFVAHDNDGTVDVIAQGGARPVRLRTYDEGPRGFWPWLNADPSPEQWLVNNTGAPIALR